MYYAILKNNVCVGINNHPLDKNFDTDGESQVEVDDTAADPIAFLGKTYANGKFVETEKTAVEKQKETNLTQILFLSDTDWKVIRHRDQLALGIPTSLTDADYKALLEARQKARDTVVKIN